MAPSLRVVEEKRIKYDFEFSPTVGSTVKSMVRVVATLTGSGKAVDGQVSG